tara:strand:+ start:1302 stop:1943 length:642 start_codon:yes stop_codon:yes gene_type:complete
MTFEANLAKYGLLDKEHRIYEDKQKQDIDTLWGTEGKSLVIPLGAWDSNIWGAIGGASDNFSIPSDVYRSIGLKEKETCQGGVLKMTVYNDSETDFLSLRMAKFMIRETDKTSMKAGDPRTNFVTSDTLGQDNTRLVHVGLDKVTAKLYKNVKTIAIPPKQLVVLDKSFLAPIYMKSATLNNEYYMYGVRLDFDTKIQIKVEIHKKVYNVNTS